MKKEKQRTKQFSVRCPEPLHGELLEIARHIGTDLNGTINQMLLYARPEFLRQAAQRAEAARQARALLDLATVNSEHPTVRGMVSQAHSVPEKGRLRVMVDFGLRHRDREDPPLKSLIEAALAVLDAESRGAMVEKEIAERTCYWLGEIGHAAAEKSSEPAAKTGRRGRKAE
jgi:hypothetical protein